MTERSTSTQPGLTHTDLIAAARAAARILADAFGLGDDVNPGQEWPIDAGDPLLRLPLSGDADGFLGLAVNDDIAERLLADMATTAGVFDTARRTVADSLGIQLLGGAVERSAGGQPIATIEISDGGQLSALVGLYLPLAPSSPGAHDFEPQAFDSQHATGNPSQASPLSVLNDVELMVTAELGRTTMQVRDLLELTPGMVVEIDRAAGAPIDLFVNGTRIASGEVVVIDEEFGIRITEILPTGERSR